MSKPKNSTGILPVCIPDDEAKRMALNSPAIQALLHGGGTLPIPYKDAEDMFVSDDTGEVGVEDQVELDSLIEHGLVAPPTA